MYTAQKKFLIILTAAASLNASVASASPFTYSGNFGMSATSGMGNANNVAMLLQPQAALKQANESAELNAAETAASSSDSASSITNQLTSEVLSTAAANFTAQSNTANTSGTLKTPNGPLSYVNNGSTITYTLPNGTQITLPIN